MADEFFKILDDRNTGPDGKAIDPKLHSRLNHPLCLVCQDDYRKKFPGKPFRIVCEGIYTDADYEEIAASEDSTLHDVKEVMDKTYWAENHYKVPNSEGELRPFICRDYQVEALSCTAERKIDRWARGLGKTSLSEITEIHTAINRNNYPIMVLCPAKHQAKKWFDELVAIFENDEELRKTILSKSQAPFYQIKLTNGSSISIFTAGSKSGRSADSVRSVSPRRIRLEEQDLLNEADYAAVTPLLRRYKDVQFGGSSTPLGKREMFWRMCTKFPDYREFYFPISRHPDWSPQMEEDLRRECNTEVRYIHEMLAEFGDQEAGVFKGIYVDASSKAYEYTRQKYDETLRYWIGVDWNGKGTGTRIRVIAYNPATAVRKVVDMQTIDETHEASIDAIFAMNKKWHCEGVCTDAGFGGMENEVIKKRGKESPDPDDRRLMNIQVIDFGAPLKTNKLVPNRTNGLKIVPEELDRRTKPFMVEGAVMAVEAGLFEFSSKDTLLDEQFRAYHVHTWSQHGWANTYDSGSFGDHDLDAIMLALLGIELKYGFLYKPARRPATATSMSLVSDFGQEAVPMALHNKGAVVEKRIIQKSVAGVQSRMLSPGQRLASSGRIAAMQGNCFVSMNTPNPGRQSGNIVTSRTGAFRNGAVGYGGTRPDASTVRRSPLPR